MLFYSFCPLLTMEAVGLTPVKRLRGVFYILQHLQSDDGGYQGGDEKESPEGGRLVEEKDAHHHRAHGADTRPHGVGRANGKRLRGLCQQPHAGYGEEQKSAHPLPIEQAGGCLCLSQAECEANFAQAGNDEDDPIHRCYRFFQFVSCKSSHYF